MRKSLTKCLKLLPLCSESQKWLAGQCGVNRIARALQIWACLIAAGMCFTGGHNQFKGVSAQFWAKASVPAVFGHKYLELKSVVLWLCSSANLSNVGCPN